MKKAALIAITAIISIALILSISGCKQGLAESLVEKAIENAAAKEGEDVDIDLSEGQVNITDEEGNEISIGGAEVPDDWPSSVPVNKDIQIQFTGSQKTDGKMNWSISGVYNGGAEDLYNYYKSELSGWNEELDSVSDLGDEGSSYSYQVSNDTYYATVFITESQDGTVSIILSVNEK
ncbi:MAG: hypothetical protein FJW66_04955 [Actinobacteria bacterium]|nr:hypothetical protein [Actinomycetota bacterium]